LKKILAAALLAGSAGGVLAAQPGDVSFAYEFGVATGEGRPAVAASARGDIVIAWARAGEDPSRDVHFVLVHADDFATPPAIPPAWVAGTAHDDPAADQHSPAVAMDAGGDFVIAWREPTAQGGWGIAARRFTFAGQPAGATFQVSAAGAADDAAPAVAMDAFGNFAVVWQRTDGGASRIHLRRFLADGTPLSGEAALGAPDVDALNPAIAMGAWGAFVVAWETAGVDADVRFQSFAADGTPDAAAAAAAALPSQARRAPAAGMDAHGRFVVAWHSTGLDGTPSIRARQFLAGGAPVAADFAVNQESPTDAGSLASVALDASGDFVVTWDAFESLPWFTGRRWHKQLFRADGTAVGYQGWGWYTASLPPAVAMDADGDAFVAFVDNERRSVMLRRMVGPEAVNLELRIDEAADPVAYGQRVRHTLVLANRHAGSAETGVPDIDAAIGLANYTEVRSHLTGAFVENLPATCVRYVDPAYLSCLFEMIPPGGSASLELSLSARQPGTVSHQADIILWSQHDPQSADDWASASTTVACAEGDGPGTLSIVGAPSVVEEGTIVQLQLQRSNGSCGTVFAQLAAIGESPTFNASDYHGFTSVGWEHGEGGIKTYQFHTTDDNTDEDTEALRIVISGTTGGAAVGTPSSTVLDLLDNDATPTLSLSVANASVVEGGTAAVEFTLQLSSRSERGITVPVTFGGTAQHSADYGVTPWLPASGLLALGATPRNTFMVRPVSDALDEDNETIVLTLGAPTHATLIGPATVSATILDDDATPTVAIVSADATVEEGGTATVRLALSAPSGRTVTVPLAWSGSAQFEMDFVAPASAAIPPGASSVEFTVAVVADRIAEPAETAQLDLGTPVNAAPGADTRFVLSIPASEYVCGQGESAGTLVLSAPASVTEGDDALIEVRRTGGACGDVSAGYATNEGGGQFTAVSGTLAWDSGEAGVQVVRVPTTEDTLDEDPGTITFGLGAPLGGAVLAEPSAVAITLADDDPTPAISFLQPGQTTREAAGASVVVHAELSAVSGREVRVLLGAGGTAARGQDWSVQNDWLVIPAGSRGAAKVVQILNNGVVELDEQVTFTLQTLVNAVPGPVPAHTVTIRDNDPEVNGLRETLQAAGAP
jgi:hypothetical protein